MNSLMKILVLSTLLIFIMSSTSAVYNDLNAWDNNNSRHANKGEDFNITVGEGIASDINSDFNYLFAFSYSDSRGTLYLDLNVNVTKDLNAADANGDANVFVRSLVSAANTPCSGGDANILVLSDTTGKDFNIFNAQITVPTADGANNTGINTFVGKPVLIEMWKIEDVDLGVTAQCVAKVADGNFIVGPAILAYSNQITSNQVPAISRALIHQNITILGFGFEPRPVDAMDQNVTISIYDANGTALNAATKINDLNISKAYDSQSVSLLGIFHRLRPDLDTNGQVMSMVGVVSSGWTSEDKNGVTVFPDTNGEFDVNFTIPVVTTGTVGRADLNTLRAYSAINGDVNAVFTIAPAINTSPVDVNATVTTGGIRYDLNTALLNTEIISDIQAVSNFIMKIGSLVNSDSVGDVVISFNSDVNLAITPVMTLGFPGTDLNARSGGYINMDTNLVARGAISVDVTMYDVNVGTATIPFITRNGQPCGVSVCTNQNGTDRTAAVAWDYNADKGDGNLAFRVSTFSIYEANPFDIEMIAPTGGEKIRVPRHGVDANYQIQFRWRDLNTADNVSRNAPLRAVITYATARGANTGVLRYDANIFDGDGIRCNGYANMAATTDISEWVTCVYDLNRADLNSGIVGEFVIDVNIASHAAKAVREQSALTGTDYNVFFNSPIIEITDVNLNDGNYVMNPRSFEADLNYIVDFNIYLPDINTDQNFSLADYNIHFYLGPSQGSIGIGSGFVSDINVLGIEQTEDQNFGISPGRFWDTNGASDYRGIDIRCTPPPADKPYWDYSCKLQYDTNGIAEINNYLTVSLVNNMTKTTNYTTTDGSGTQAVVVHVVDINEMWDNNSSVYKISINDNNVPRARFGASGDYDPINTTITGTSYIATLGCDDNVSGPYQYFYREGSEGAWIYNGDFKDKVTIRNTTDSELTKTYYGGCKDYAGNISDINGTITVTLRPPGSRTSPSAPSSPGGTTPPAVEGTETILTIEIQGTPPIEDIESTLEEAGFTEEEIATATIIAENTAIDQTVVVDKITSETGLTSYQTWVSVKVHNTSDQKWKDVKVIVEIPKGIASDASQISSEFAMNVLKADPIIEFTIPEIQVGEIAEVKYSTDKQISDVTARLLPLGMVTAYSEVAPCEGVVCEAQSCATGACNTTTGQCEYDYYADGTVCEGDKVCESGTCVEKIEPTPPPIEPEPPVDYNTLPIVVIVIIIVVIGAAAYYMKSKGKGK